MKIDQLWQKLALGFIGVAISAIMVAYLLVNYVIDIEFQGYVSQRERAVYERIGSSLASSYVKGRGWDDQLAEMLPHFAVMNRIEIEVRDAGGSLIASAPFGDDPERNREVYKLMGVGESFQVVRHQRITVPIVTEKGPMGTIAIAPMVVVGEPTEDQKFRQSLNSSLVLGGLLAVTVALSLSLIISTRLTRPLASMIKAARRLEDGNLSERVEVATVDEVGQLGEAFNHLAQTLEQQENLRKNLTADVAHELRTPLAVIRSYVEACMDGVMEPNEKNLESIHEEIMRLGRLVDDLGQLSKAESGHLDIKMAPADVGKLVASIVEALRPFFVEQEIDIQTRVEGQVVAGIDEDKIRQVIVNLLGNAAKFTPAGGRVTVTVEKDKSHAIISIADTGIGIDEKVLPLIFERFYRVEKSRNRETGGSGIGLTIAGKLISAHSGKIDVRSRPGTGSTFIVRIPLKPSKRVRKG